MKMPNLHTITRAFFLFLLASVLASCGMQSEAGQDNAIAKIEAMEWPPCASVSQKTVYDAFFNHDDFAERLMLAGQVSAILEELDDSRRNFKETGDLVDIFPLVMFYQYRDGLDLAMRPTVTLKKEFLRTIISEYDSYYRNRAAYDEDRIDDLDKQWRLYFDSADAAQEDGIGEWTADAGVNVLLEGVNAYLMYDLPRALRYVTSKNKDNIEPFAKDFEKFSDLYQDAEQLAKKDVLTVLPGGKEKKSAEKLFGNGTEYVSYIRSKSWEMGVGDGPLGVLQEQPVYDHDTSNRKFFPKKLMKRGICR